MKELKKINKKSKAATILIIVTLLLLASNFFIANNSKSTNEAIKAIYNDRLMASHYVFEYNNQIHLLKTEIAQPSVSDFTKKQIITSHLDIIKTIDKKYLQTLLTDDEKEQFLSFQLYCKKIATASQSNNWTEIEQLSELSLERLELLAQIQVDEGKIKLATAQTLHNGNKIFTQFEIGLFIILGCLSVYLLVLKKIKHKIQIPEPPSMN